MASPAASNPHASNTATDNINLPLPASSINLLTTQQQNVMPPRASGINLEALTSANGIQLSRNANNHALQLSILAAIQQQQQHHQQLSAAVLAQVSPDVASSDLGPAAPAAPPPGGTIDWNALLTGLLGATPASALGGCAQLGLPNHLYLQQPLWAQAAAAAAAASSHGGMNFLLAGQSYPGHSAMPLIVHSESLAPYGGQMTPIMLPYQQQHQLQQQLQALVGSPGMSFGGTGFLTVPPTGVAHQPPSSAGNQSNLHVMVPSQVAGAGPASPGPGILGRVDRTSSRTGSVSDNGRTQRRPAAAAKKPSGVDKVTIKKSPPSNAVGASGVAAGSSGNRAPIIVYMDCDEESLSEYQCVLRKQIELFEATAEDVQWNTQGRNKAISLGQVGIRCRYCSRLPTWSRARGAVYYSATLAGLYQAAQNMAKNHLCRHCRLIPEETLQKLVNLRDCKRRAAGGKKYWAEGALVLGVVQCEDGLRFKSAASQAA